MQVHPDTIHFDDRPWSVRGCVYDGQIRYRFMIPENVIFEAAKDKNNFTPKQMVEFVKEKAEAVESICKKRKEFIKSKNRELKENCLIIVTNL